MADIRWSNSALRTLQECGEKFRRRYIEKEYTPSSVRGLRGTVVHRVASSALLRKLTDNTLPSVEEAKDLAADEFKRQWAGGVKLSREEAAEGAGKVQAQAKDFAVDLSGFHVGTVAPVINPIGVERKITVKPKDSDLVILGTIDLIDGAPEGEIIRDLKTAEKSPQQNAAETSQQLTMYSMIRMAEVGTMPASLRLDYLVRTPVRAEKRLVPLTTTRTREDVAALVARINNAVEAVKKGIFVPANPESWYCSRQYCDYFESCVYVRRGDSRPQS